MRSFLKQATLFILAQVLLLAVVFARFEVNRESFHTALADKHRRLEEAPSPRIILVGGSNLVFGVDSERLEEKLGYHPVNMGLMYGLGLDFILREVDGQMKRGDVVVLSLEYEHFVLDCTQGSAMVETLLQYPKALTLFGPRQFKATLDAGLNSLGPPTRFALMGSRSRGATAGTAYMRKAFNAYGDVVAHRDLPPNHAFLTNKPMDLSAYSAWHARGVIRDVQQFCDRCEAQGIQVFYQFPPLTQPVYEKWRTEIEAISGELEHGMKIPILNHPADLAFPIESFFDTQYHLTFEKAKLRTDALIAGLEPYLASQPANPE